MNPHLKKSITQMEFDFPKFKKSFLQSLSKLSVADTCKQAYEEIRLLLYSSITQECINFMLSSISDTNEHQKLSTKREYLKVLILICEIIGDKLLEFIPKIFNLLNKKISEGELHLNQVVSDVFAALMEKVIRKLALNQGFKTTNFLMSGLYNNLSQSNKSIQIGSAMCLIKLIQNCPLEYLMSNHEQITMRILEFLRNGNCRAQTHLLEAILSLILSVEKEFKTNVKSVMDYIIELFDAKEYSMEWTLKKISIDLIYTLAIILKDSIVSYKTKILDILQENKSDKIKYVREAALIAINLVRNLDEHESEKEIENEKENNLKRFDYPKTSSKNIMQKYMNLPKSEQKLPVIDLSINKSEKYESVKEINGKNSNHDFGNMKPEDLEYIYEKMQTIMIQQNKIYENFSKFESKVFDELNLLKEKVCKLEKENNQNYDKEKNPKNYNYYSLRKENEIYYLHNKSDTSKTKINNNINKSLETKINYEDEVMKKLNILLESNEINEAIKLSLLQRNDWLAFSLIREKNIDLHYLNQQTFNSLTEKINFLLLDRENNKKFLSWCEDCLEDDILKSNLTLLKVKLILTGMLNQNINESVLDYNDILIIKKIFGRINFEK